MGFRLLRVTPTGWALIAVAGAVFGLGLARLTGWPGVQGVVVGIVVLWLVLRLLDRRAWRRALTVIRDDRSVATLQRLAADLKGVGLDVAVSKDPKGIACRGRDHRKVVARISAWRG